MKRTAITVSIILALILTIGAMGGCSSRSYDNGAQMAPAASTASAARADFYGGATNIAPQAAPMTEEYAFEAEMDMAAPRDAVNIATGGGEMGGAGVGSSTGSSAIRPSNENRKIIYTADVALQTKDFENGVLTVEKMTEEIGGFIESSSVQGHNMYNQGYQSSRWAYFTVRVPDSKLQQFLDGLSADFNVSSTSLYSSDITLDYFDVKARLESLEIQQERLLEMLGQSTEVEYLIEVQKELSRVNYEIESYTSSLNRMDDSVNYSTVHLNIEEVVEYDNLQPVTATFGEQISGTFSAAWRGFVNLCRNTVLFFVGATPFFAFAIPIAAVVVLFLRRRGKKRRLATESAPPKPDNSPTDQTR